MAESETLPYDKTDRQSIYRYALELLDSTLREKTGIEELPTKSGNKGSFGSAVEQYYFMLGVNNKSEADFPEAGLELKTTPLKRNKDGRIVSKERLAIGMIDYMDIVNETFETSHLIEKAEDILLISYLWEAGKSTLDYVVKIVEIVSLKKLPESDIAQIKADWETVVEKVRAGHAHELSSSDTLYLEACTKSNKTSKPRKQPYSPELARPRAWALKASFMTALSTRLFEQMESIERSAGEKSLPLIELIRKRFKPYFGLTEQELGNRFGRIKDGETKPKNLCALITKDILGVSNDAKIEEFEKAGVKPKTMRIKRNGMPKEAMSFPYFDYFELAATPFEESDFLDYMLQKYLFVIYREDAEERGVYRLADVMFWQMPEQDLPEARRCYEEMRHNVVEGKAEVSVKSTENRCCHVRPHDTKTTKPLPTPQGTPMKRKCFWLNQRYLKEEIAAINAKRSS